MKTSPSTFLLTGTALLLCAIASSHAATLTPISATGWNYDVVYEVGATGSGNATFTNESFALFEEGLNASTGGGLPVSHSLISNVAGTTFTLQSYTANNALIVAESGSPSKFATLDVANANYSQIALLGLSAGGGGDFSMVLYFTDGTNTGLLPNDSTPNASTRGTFDGQILPDWFATGGSSNNGSITVAGSTFGRVDSGNGGGAGAGGIYLQQLTFDLATANSGAYATKTLDYITFESIGGGGNNRSILAISGAVVPEPSSLLLLVAGVGFMAARRCRQASAV